ncbi:hypothetical protein ACFW9M_19355 [Streptomyces lydicus]|uniref:hypothetical protein n=1 Tax=Streptomyces lydicus TaxID=47763 RepID=UPI003678AED7
MPAGAPEAAATVLRTARELLRQSYYCYEFSTIAVMHSLIAVEIVLRDRRTDDGTTARTRCTPCRCLKPRVVVEEVVQLPREHTWPRLGGPVGLRC